ncbi:hypothetical protein BVY01_00350 [bacterium I07]|nr:hypothetical protein BVY01_00350 [bacterium I07]
MAEDKILIVDDDPQIRMFLADRLKVKGYRVLQAHSGKEGLKKIKEDSPDLVLLDLQMPEMDGLTLLKILQKEQSDLPVIILTAHGTIEHAVEAMKYGALDFLPKPCKPDHILLLMQRALESKTLKDENKYLRDELQMQHPMVVGNSPAMKKIKETAEKVAGSKSTVLILGESGTGKQLLARAIYHLSDRREKPFVQVNCTTLSEHLLESDLFGHEKGAFTGAIKQKKGRFELANRGTVFLDEMGDLPLSIQAKLLFVLEYGEFQRVGGIDSQSTDVRIIAATNKDLSELVNKNLFREDLYFRINVVSIQIPPLRDRMEDLPVFIDCFLKKHCRAMQKPIPEISQRTMEILKNYSWPGNIRELENVIERAVVLSSGEKITPDVLPELLSVRSAEDLQVGLSLEEAQQKFKKQFILKTLQQTNHSQTEAAKILGLQRTYLNRLIKGLGIS